MSEMWEHISRDNLLFSVARRGRDVRNSRNMVEVPLVPAYGHFDGNFPYYGIDGRTLHRDISPLEIFVKLVPTRPAPSGEPINSSGVYQLTSVIPGVLEWKNPQNHRENPYTPSKGISIFPMTQLLGAFNIHLKDMSSSKRKDPFPLGWGVKIRRCFKPEARLKVTAIMEIPPKNKFLEASLKSDYCNSSRCVNYMIKLQQVKQVGKLCRVILYVQNCLKAAI